MIIIITIMKNLHPEHWQLSSFGSQPMKIIVLFKMHNLNIAGK